jgi:hypothetical protein
LGWAHAEIIRYRTITIHTNPASATPTNPASNLAAQFVAQRVRLKLKSDTQVQSVREWYLNGPLTVSFMRGLVNRKKTSIYEHERNDRARVSDRYELLQYTQNGVGCIFIDTGTYSFWIETVPHCFPPAWSHKLMIEYRSDWGGVPDPDARSRISDIVGYLLGRELISIGHSELSHDGYILAKDCQGHLRPGIRTICAHWPRPPIPIDETPEAFSASFLRTWTAYERKYPILPISECLHRYWVAVRQPPSMSIVILASTLEYLSKAWFATASSRSRGKYISHEQYREILSPEIDTLAPKLMAHPQGDAVLKRILSAYNFGSTDQLEQFFSELGIDLVAEERSTLRKRNKYVHGHVVEPSEARATVARYEALFTRALIRILEIG